MDYQLGIRQVDINRLAKLPAYAQDEIIQSRQRIEELTRELDRLLDPQRHVTTVAEPHAVVPQPVGDNPTIRHRFASDDLIDVEFRPDGLRVTGVSASYWTTPVVIPEVSNVLWVRMVDTRMLPGGKQ